MPLPANWFVRLVWVAVQLLCLMSIDAAEMKRYRFWTAYLAAGVMLGVFYWPEVDGWYDGWWPVVLGLVLLRLMACLEALHRETGHYQHWHFLSSGGWLLAVMNVSILWKVKGISNRDVSIELGYFANIWAASAMFYMLLGWLVVGGLRSRSRFESWHAVIVGLLVAGHAALSIIVVVQGPPTDLKIWEARDLVLTCFDSLLYLGWVLLISLLPTSSGARRDRVLRAP